MSLLLTNNTSVSTVSAGGVIPLGSAVHGYGRSIRLNGNTINLSEKGYYEVTANASVEVTGSTAITMTMYQDGVAVAGTAVSETPTAAGATVNITIVWIVRKTSCCCSCNNTALTFVLDSAGSVGNMTVEVKSL